jgi:rfaE bifunctional protein kinase chain/domain
MSRNDAVDFHQALKDALAEAHTKRILVIGDVMLDTYITGEITRRSPEAPVNILKQTQKTHHLGGAGNTANNLASLGVQTTLLGIIGNDTDSKIITELVKTAKIKSKLITDKTRPTTTKTRVVDSQGHIIRIDNESVKRISRDIEKQILNTIASLPQFHAVIVSDYAKGVLTPTIIKALQKKFGYDKLFVDTKPEQIKYFKKVGLIKLNASETQAITGICPTTNDLTKQALEKLQKIVDGNIVITRGAKGLALYEKSANIISFIKAHKVKVRDVTGAGDTTLAITALLATDHNFTTALTCANYVAGLAVAQRGTTSFTIEKL